MSKRTTYTENRSFGTTTKKERTAAYDYFVKLLGDRQTNCYNVELEIWAIIEKDAKRDKSERVQISLAKSGKRECIAVELTSGNLGTLTATSKKGNDIRREPFKGIIFRFVK